VYKWLLLVSIIIIISAIEIIIPEFVIDDKNNLKNMRVHLQNYASADGFAKQLLEMKNRKLAIDEST
jgi:hypothetical protein